VVGVIVKQLDNMHGVTMKIENNQTYERRLLHVFWWSCGRICEKYRQL